MIENTQLTISGSNIIFHKEQLTPRRFFSMSGIVSNGAGSSDIKAVISKSVSKFEQALTHAV